jgi:hypothetical protein
MLLLVVSAFGAKSFHPPSEGELLLFCLSKREVTKRKRPPAYALCGHRARKVRGWVTGFVDSTSCADAKLAGIRAGHPAGCSSTHPPLQRGPGQSNAHPARTFQKSQSNSRARLCFAFAFHRVRATKARCSTWGPCAAVRRGRQAAQRESTGMSTPFRQGRSPVEKPGPGSRTCRAGARQAPSGVAFLFGYLSLWPHKEKVTRAPKAHESSCFDQPTQSQEHRPLRGSYTKSPTSINRSAYADTG